MTYRNVRSVIRTGATITVGGWPFWIGGMIMGRFFEETMQGLLEAVAVDKGEIPLIEKEDMPATTFVAGDMEKN